MKKLNNKGFTLIEIVIVIVIIAILAAMLVPSLTSWITKSKIKTFTSACSEVRTAVAAELSENFAEGGTGKLDDADVDWDAISADLGEKTVSLTSGDYVVSNATNNDTDAGFMVQDVNYAGTWDGTKWTIDEDGGFGE